MKNPLLFCLLFLLSLISFPANTEALKPEPHLLFFQTLTLLPGKLQKFDLPTAIGYMEGYVGILITEAKEASSEFFQKPVRRTPYGYKKRIALQVFLYTDRGRTLTMKLKKPDPDSISDRAIFLSEVRLNKNESINKMGLVSDKPITLLKIEWFESLSK